jgi:hypothetical protein
MCDANVVVAQVHHDGLGKALEAKFRGVVGRCARKGVYSRQTADVDNKAPAGLLHQRYGLVHAVERPAEIGIDDGAPMVGRGLMHGRETADSGVVYQDVELPETLGDRSEQFLDLLKAADVAGVALDAAQRFQFVDGGVDGFLAAAAEDHGNSLL